MPPARTVGHRGSITLELIIAFAVASLVLTSTILLTGGSDALAFERENAERAIASELMREGSTTYSMSSSSVRDGITYHATALRTDVTPCVSELDASATSTGGIGDGVTLSMWSTDATLAVALGGDCEARPAASTWQHIGTQNTVSEGAATAVDALAGQVYVGLSDAPYLALFTASGTPESFANGFALPAAPRAIDAAFADGTPYVFAVLATSTQLAVISVSDPRNPILVATSSLAGVDSGGADPTAYHVRYDSGRVYVTTRYIAGPQPELHVFDVQHPASPRELGAGNLETTVNGMALDHYLYAATTYDTRELAIYDVRDPARISLAGSVDLPGNQDGESVAIQGSRLYLGRASNTSGPELYAFDLSDPLHPALVGTAEIASKDITAVVPLGSLLFVAATNDGASNRLVEVWSTAHMVLLSSAKDPGLALGGIDYASDAVFAVSSATLSIYAGN